VGFFCRQPRVTGTRLSHWQFSCMSWWAQQPLWPLWQPYKFYKLEFELHSHLVKIWTGRWHHSAVKVVVLQSPAWPQLWVWCSFRAHLLNQFSCNQDFAQQLYEMWANFKGHSNSQNVLLDSKRLPKWVLTTTACMWHRTPEEHS